MDRAQAEPGVKSHKRLAGTSAARPETGPQAQAFLISSQKEGF